MYLTLFQLNLLTSRSMSARCHQLLHLLLAHGLRRSARETLQHRLGQPTHTHTYCITHTHRKTSRKQTLNNLLLSIIADTSHRTKQHHRLIHKQRKIYPQTQQAPSSAKLNHASSRIIKSFDKMCFNHVHQKTIRFRCDLKKRRHLIVCPVLLVDERHVH